MSGNDNNDEDFAALLAEYENKNPSQKKRRDPAPGELVKGRVVSIGHDAVFIDLGAKSEGMIDLIEVRDETGKLAVAIGDEVQARVVESGKAGCIVLRRSIGRGADSKAELEDAHRLGIPVEGLVSAVNKGGVEVQVAGLRGFCPMSQLDIRHVEDANAFIGQRLTFRIVRIETGRGQTNVVLNRRALLEEEQQARAAVTRSQLVAGAIVKGHVTSLKEYGAFVDLGGLEGMLHVSELGYSRVTHPKDLLSIGQEVEVSVLKIEKTEDPNRPKISLSLKSLAADPWKDVADRFAEGRVVRGKVVRMETFGAFVELAPGIEGLIHISELGGNRRVNHPREVLKIGQELAVRVAGVDLAKRKVSLTPSDVDLDDAPAAQAPAPKLGTFADLLKSKRK